MKNYSNCNGSEGPYRYYKFLSGDDAYVIWPLTDEVVACKVICCYTSDKYNHEAAPHKRYCVQITEGKFAGEIYDICELEITEG